MDDEAAIRCMRHCSNEYNIFFVNFPEFCPICKGKIKGSCLVLPPFCVPHPFVSCFQALYSIVVKPTEGCFLKTYRSGHDLHIGLTSSKGLVYNYDESGVHMDNHLSWPMCIAVDILDILKSYSASVILKDWDKTLCEHSNKSEWTCDKYGPTLHNCYDFVLSFLKDILPGCHGFVDKDSFCNTHILPRTTKAAQYIDLYRKVVDNGLFVSKASSPD